MKIERQNISMIRGDSEVITVSCKDKNGGALPFQEGDTVYFTVKKSLMASDISLKKVLTSFSEGKALIPIEPSDTKEMNVQSYVYDIQWNKADGTVTTIVPKSTFTLEGEVTDE